MNHHHTISDRPHASPPLRETIHARVEELAARVPAGLEAKDYRFALIGATSSAPRGQELHQLDEAFLALSVPECIARAAWMYCYEVAKRGGLDEVLRIAGGDPWGFRA